ncbi:cellobiose-specific PTS system IIC component [Levilactobacillus acidifarinae DSM 19394]|uniref:Cellobiose-specific PTS system IIC component n=1 Tax=Levilactobacillus acidifarinae DSM 19394 = JCM 15949 TaxID=1423715 RepID=A0A0R1LKG2_9LACO|nr:cellobiose-specific PTS system IIC component [Levilactobacillus acidifarinae DSM 19394]
MVMTALRLVFPLVLVGTLADLVNRSWLESTGYYYQTLHVTSWLLRRTRLQQGVLLVQTGALGLAVLGVAFAVSYLLIARVTRQTSDRLMGGGLAVLALQFLNVNPATLRAGRPLDWTAMNLGLTGLALGIAIGLLIGNLYGWSVKRWSQPSDVVIRPLTLGTLGVLLTALLGVLWLMRAPLGSTTGLTAWLRGPLTGASGWGSLLGVSVLNGGLAWLGVLSPLPSTPQQAAMAAQNLATVLETNSWRLPHPLTGQTILQPYANMGGTGMTLGLLVAIFLVTHNATQRHIGWLSVLPVLGNFNAPLLVGLPVILSPILWLPFLLAPAACLSLSSLCLALHWVPASAYAFAVGTPGPLISYLGTGGALSALGLASINLVLSTAIYYPFVKWAAIAEQRVHEEAISDAKL